MSTRPPSKHHYIPEFYLRWWRGQDGKIERFTRPRNQVVVRRVYPSEMGWQKDLYASPEPDEARRQWLEQKFFRTVDNLAAKVLFKLNESLTPDLSDLERSAWCIFTMSLLHRTPENLVAYKQGAYRVLEQVTSDLEGEYAARRGPNDPTTFGEFIANRKPDDDERSILESLPKIIVNQNIGQTLFSLPWRIVDVADAKNELLISDHPVARTNGILRPGGHLAMPLSPRRLLIIAGAKDVPETVERTTSDQLVSAMNASSVGGARHFVGACDRRQTRFIANRFGRLEVLRLGHGTMDFD